MCLKTHPTIVAALLAGAALLWPTWSHARDGVAIPLPDQRVAVVSEGDLEAASIGSYSVAVFKDAALLDFAAGAVFSRDGSVFPRGRAPQHALADINGDGVKELIVFQHTAGSGDYVQVDALRLDAHAIKLVVRVSIDTRHDAIAALKAGYKARVLAGRRAKPRP
jgi:hypothetical protein